MPSAIPHPSPGSKWPQSGSPRLAPQHSGQSWAPSTVKVPDALLPSGAKRNRRSDDPTMVRNVNR
ncbi:hypothetical protein M7I_0571 [Glarea lozoyensis 74030]|uniref:Uncharacterized protein n=1 Tax=Glarea lozoyensis (strain ATCC 74030 / MF5533) TaxID=1104152 RepID=H0EDW2_GLAL7|nr:hypothetical protein M7I_0571 [Glarea lozoyensis 74030]